MSMSAFTGVSADTENGENLIYKANTGDVYKYEIHFTSIRSSERGGQTSEMSTTRNVIFTLEKEKDNDPLSFILKTDYAESYMESPRGGREMDMTYLEGKRIRFQITPKGELHEVTPIDSISMPQRGEGRRGDAQRGRRVQGRERNPAAMLGIRFFRLPDRPLQVGDSWTETRHDTTGPGNERLSQKRIEERKTTYSVVGIEDRMGFSCLHIKVQTTYIRESYGTRGGVEMNSEGEGEVKADIWFATKKGILVEYTTADFYEGTTAFSGERSSTTPTMNETEMTLKLIEYLPKK
jgi:hypothetical protein